MINYKRLGVKCFKRTLFDEAATYFSLAYEVSGEKGLLFLTQLCSLAKHSPQEARMLFELFLAKDKFGKSSEEFEEILEILESRFEPDFAAEEQDAISYDDFMEAVWREGDFKRVFENIMFSTKIMISNRDDFLEFLENLIDNDFLEMGINYLESASDMFAGDARVEALWREIARRRDDENLR